MMTGRRSSCAISLQPDMATVVDGQYTPLNGGLDGEETQPRKRSLFKDTQGNMVELSQMITHPGMRKAESMEVLNLTLHQVRHTFRFLFCLAFLTRLCVLFP